MTLPSLCLTTFTAENPIHFFHHQKS